MKKKLSLLLSGILCTNIIWSNTVIAETTENKNKKRPAEITSLGDYKTYNAVAWGNHEASGADIEGRLAVKGDIKSPTEAPNFDIGAAYGPGAGVGNYLEENGTPTFLLGGDIINPVGKLQLCFGYGAMTFENNPVKLHESMVMKGTFVESEANIDKTFNQILVDVTDKSVIAKNVIGSDALIEGMSFGLAKSTNRNNTFTNTTHRDVEVFNVGKSVAESGYEQAKLPIISEQQNIIIYSEAKKVNFNRGIDFEGDEVNSGSAIMKQLAPRIVWVFPNATEVMVFKNDVAGTVIAPKAAVSIHGGSINGQVFAKDIYQVKKVIQGPNGEQVGTGGEIHNFLFNWDIFDDLKEKYGTLTLTKLNEDRKPLANVEFIIRDSDGKELRRGKTDADGKVTFEELPQGNYTYEEVSAPTGYVTDTKKYPFQIVDGNIVEKDVVNKKIKGNLRLKKVSSQVGEDGQQIFLEGAKFVIKDANKEIVKEGIITNSDGIIEIADLEYGVYYYQEVEAPEGYVLDDTEHEFAIKEDGQTIEIIVKNQKLSEVKILKTDAETNKPLSNAKFIIKNANGEKVGEGFTNTEGILVVGNLPIGKYIYEEVQAPIGYEFSDNSKGSFEVKENGEIVVIEVTNIAIEGPEIPEIVVGELKITKKGDDGKLLAGAEFEVRNSKNEVVTTGITDEAGIIHIGGLLPGEYTFKEIKAPEGYELNNTIFEFVITESTDGVQVIEKEVVNKREKGNLELQKLDADNDKKFLEGAVFKITDLDGNSKDYTTNADGKIILENLQTGTYRFEEIKAPAGYELNENNKGTFIIENGKVTITKITNKKIIGSLEITKKGDDGKLLAGAEFNVLDKDGNVVKTGVTNDKGVANITGLEAGEYKLVEVKAPTGYISEKFEIEFTISEQGQVIPKEVINKRIKSNVNLKKVDSEDKTLGLKGAEFTIKNSNKETIIEGEVTNDQGIIELGELEFGTYYYQEVKAPEGYVLDDKEYEFKVTEHGKVIILEVTNIKEEEPIPPTPINGYLEITKVDADDNKKLLEGAEFTVYNEAGEEVGKGITNKDGKIRISNLKDGKYTAVETKAPEGYELNTENRFEFELSAGNKVESIIVTNKKIEEPIPPTPINGYLEITKVDADDNKKLLEGAEFTVYNEAGEEVGKGITNKDGKIRISNLKDGKYTAVETKAPEGYELNTENRFEFELSAGNKVENIVVTNKVIKKPEPPVDPEKPEPPVDPEKPEPPVDPEKPEPPVDPEKPEPPVNPGKPEPEKPVKPTNPGEEYPHTSDDGIVGNVMMGLVAIAGLFIINRRRY